MNHLIDRARCIMITHSRTDWSVRPPSVDTGDLFQASKMKSRLLFRPDLTDCILEDRSLLATPNLGIIILTSSGYALITPFPGANSSAGGSLGSNGPSGGSASGV